jgi:hypothetical protein
MDSVRAGKNFLPGSTTHGDKNFLQPTEYFYAKSACAYMFINI